MKFFVIAILLFVTNQSFAQSGSIQVLILNSDSGTLRDNVFVELKSGNQTVFHGYELYNRQFTIAELTPGTYKLIISQMGARADTYDSIIILNGQAKQLTLAYPGPCRFIYHNGYTPTCAIGHTDNIIPIVYGLPGKRLMKKSKKGKVHLGGCVITNCDPRFYCRLHKLEI